MMLSDLENLIVKLHECLSESHSSEIARSIISDIAYIFSENNNSQAIAYCLSVFFKPEKSVLTFLRKSITKDELKDCKIELLHLLYKFISVSDKQILPFAAEIKDACISIFNSDKYSDVRCATFPIIAKILELSSGNTEIASKLNLNKLADNYFLSLINQSKLSGSLKGNVMNSLGLICRYHPLEMVNYSNKCLTLFLNTLKIEVTEHQFSMITMSKKLQKPEFKVIAGTLEGLNNYLFNFTQSAEENSEHAWQIFDYSKQALLANTEDITRFAVPRAALDLFAKHAEQFDEFIYDGYADLFERISKWTQHKNYDIKKLAYITLDSYYKQLAEMLKKKAKDQPEKCKRIITFFMQKFFTTLTNDEAKDLRETAIAIKGYGAFVGPCKKFMEPKDIRLMFNIIIDMCERTFFLNLQQDQQIQSQLAEIFDEKIYQLPSFIESLAYVCNEIDDNLPEGTIYVLEKLIILAIDSYPKLQKRYDYQISLSVARLFISIQISQPNLCAEFISQIVYQSLIRIFSYKTNYFLQQDQLEQRKYNNGEDINNEEDKSADNIFNITSNHFLKFWSNLLNLNEFKELNTIGVHVNEKKKLIGVIYDEFIESIIKIIKKLDLNAVKIDTHIEQELNSQQQQQSNDLNNASSNPVNGLRPTKPRDFEILINLVDFTKELLMQKHFDLFEKWMFKFSQEIILLSSKHVLISGFYKLNTLCMRIAIKIAYFNNINDSVKTFKSENAEEEKIDDSFDTDGSLNDSMQTDDPLQYEKLNCFYLYKKYLKEISVRKKQFKDELLASSLEFILSLPKELVVLNLNEVFESLEDSLELGINYLPLAENALNSLEYWLKTIKLEKLKSYFSLILNRFNDYLQMNKSMGGSDEVAIKEKSLVVPKVNYKGRGRKKLIIKMFEKNTNIENSDLYEKIQFRILKILGQLAGEISHSLYESNIANQIIAWDTVQHLKFSVPFLDMKPNIYFDRFLQRIIYLSLSSTNRQTKINACELLHAIVVFMIGRSVSDPQAISSPLYQMNKIYHFIYPALFKLACDVDSFVRNLYQPLVMQMIHWFTGNRKYESLETIELLNCIMDSLVDENDASLRDFSAMALKEFLRWSIKHTPLVKQDAETNLVSPVNVKSILKRIFSFLTHPSSSKRLGAALAWNSIYVIFREEEVLVNKHIFELLYYLIESLALAEKDDKMYGTQEHSKLGLDHVERIIKVKSEILNQRNPDRVKPPGWTESVLEVAVRWLMRQCGRIETECRHKSMELAYKLAPCLTNIKEPKDYFQSKLKTETEIYFLARFEGSTEKKEILKDSLCNFKTLADLGTDHFELSFVRTWLSMLIAPLDCYSWVFGERLLTPKSLFSSQKSCIWDSIDYFINNIMNFDLIDLIKNVYYKNKPQLIVICTPNEHDEYKQSKCTAIVRLIDFLCTMIGIYSSESIAIIPQNIWCEQFFTCLINLCLDPHSIGFNLNDVDVYTNLPMKTRTFLKIFTQFLPQNIQQRFKNQCIKLIDEKKQFQSFIDNITSLIKSESTNNAEASKNITDWVKLCQLVNGYEQLSEFNLYNISLDLNRIIFEYLNKITKENSKNYEQESLTFIEAKRRLFNLSLSINFSSIQKSSKTKTSLNKSDSTINDYLIEILDKYLFHNDRETLFFFNYYKNEICNWICKRYDSIVKYILGKVKLNFAKSINLLINLAEYMVSEKQIRKTYGSKVLHILYENWSMFSEYWQNDALLENKFLLIDLLTKSILVESVFNNKNNETIKQVSEMYMTLLVDRKTKLNFKAKLLDLLYFFCDAPTPYLIKSYIGQFIAQLPLKSKELVKGENAYDDYVNIIRKLLVSIELSGSFDLINVIVNIFCRETEHICEDEIQSSLIRFIKRTESTKQTNLINIYWEASLKSTEGISDERKYSIFKKVLINFLKNCDKYVFMDFMCQNIIFLISLLETELKETSFELSASNKKCSFEIIELAYKRLSKSEIFLPNAKLCMTYETAKFGQIKDGKELTKEVLRKCRKYLIEEVKFISNLNSATLEKYQNLQRQLHSFAYNCLVALFIRTQTEPKLYLAFLFKDDSNKNEFIFEPLIDKKIQYKFPIEFENFQDRKTKIISLRNEFRETSDQPTSGNVKYMGSLHSTNTMINNALATPNLSNQQISYLNTQNMYESSLSEELSVFDFTSSSLSKSFTSSGPQATNGSLNILSSQPNQFRKKFSGLYLQSDDLGDQKGQGDSAVEIELDELNHHESMSSFIELIQSLVVNKITPIYEKNQTPSEMPPWMLFLHKKVSDIYTHENLKLFLIRAIINTKNVFKPFAKFWYAPLIGFLVNSSLSREETMDYFTLELIVVLLSWHSVSLPQQTEKKLLNRLFESLMKRAYHTNRSILKNNLELLKTMTELWKDLIEVPVDIIYNYLKNINDSKKLTTGIQLFGVVLANNIQNYIYPENLNCLDFYKSLMKSMRDKSKTIHAPGAEVVGMLLKNVESKILEMDSDSFNELIKYLFEILRELDIDLFITCIHRIQLNYAPISERFMSKLLFHLPSLYGEFKQMCAEAILSSIKQMDDPLFKTKGFLEMITHRENSLQLVSLKMIYELLDKQNDEEINRLLPIICSFKNHPNSACRYQMLLILISIYEKYQFKVNELGNPNTSKIKQLTNETLLQSLLDEDQRIRLLVQNFWTEKANMPSNTIDRMVLILEKMYSPQTEAEYLSYSTNLLLERTSKSPDYNRLIYENPLSECTFREYNLSTDWRRRHEMMTPLFVDSISSLSESMFDHSGQGESYQQGTLGSNLRATQQTFQFQPTQEVSGSGSTHRKAYNWLTQSSVDTFRESFMSGTFSETQSALLFKKQQKPSSDLTSGPVVPDPDQDIYRLRKKFLKDKTATVSKFYIQKYNEKKQKELEERKEMKLKRTGQVEKYRKYRIGDFPDIQIKYWEMIAPLQALAQRDSQMAMMLFDSLFASILSEVSYLKDESESNLVIKNIESNINKILNMSESYDPNFIACLLEIAIKHAKNFRLDISSISTSCLNSLQQPLGIILIEEYLILIKSLDWTNIKEENQPKKIKLSEECKQISEESLLWIELAKLYRSMNDYDSIKGIFMKNKNLATEFTINGLNYESNNDYYLARKCYMDALEQDWPDDDEYHKTLKVEEELWEQLLLRCCNELTDWKTMCEWTTQDTSLKNLYTSDSYTNENLFPFAFKSKLKLILQEDIVEQKKHQDFVKFIQELDSDNKKILEQTFCQELSLFSLHQKDLNAAKYYAYVTIQKYLMEWSAINKTIVQGRMTKLQSLQSIVELNEFLNFVDQNQTYTNDLNRKVDSLINLWSNSMPNMHSDPPSTWDDVITNRCIYFEYIEDKYYKESSESAEISAVDFSMLNDEDVEEKKKILNKIEKAQIEMKIKFAQAAQFQRNYKLALNKLQQLRSISKSQSRHLADLQVSWMHCYLRTHLARSKAVNNPDEALNMFFGALTLKEIVKYDNNPELLFRKDLKKEQQLLHAGFTKFLVDSLENSRVNSSNYFNNLMKDEKKQSQLFDYIKTKDVTSLEETIDRLIKHGVDSLSKIDNDMNGSLELASYCDHFLRLYENEDDEQASGNIFNKIEIIKKEFPEMVIKSLLNAIRLNSYEARQKFPRLLQILSSCNSKIVETFIKSSENIPCWMFLSWLSQMTALLDKPEAKSVYHIIDSIADEYPQALVYPFNISLEGFKFDYDTKEQKEFVEKIKQKLGKVPLVNQFICSLEQLSNPELIFKDYLSEINSNIKNREAFFRIFREMYTNLIDSSSHESSSFSIESIEWGSIRKNFSKFMKSRFETEFGPNGQKVISMSESEIKQKLTKLNNDLGEYIKSFKDGNLGEYSPWLKRFKRNAAKDLEMPGQYSGKSKPILEYHVKIESFDERILVLSSLRRPKCITIRGNDQKEHKFMVKGGEDQRQDQRIETLFELINDLLKSDPKCYQRNLSLRTYQVIPMTTKLALIEWIPETKTLKDVILSARTEEEIKQWEQPKGNPDIVYYHYIDEASKEIEKWKGFNLSDSYGIAFIKYKREYVSKAFKEIENLVPWDLLRRFIRTMSSSTEGYYYLRNQFIMSYAVACACQYVLGIGDRHLSNWMIDMKSGKAIGIDFGMAFGHATLNIPVPELIPIRLTRQILNLNAPLEQYGLFEASMQHTLRALRENNDLLMCILDVFIKEPSIDWIGSALRASKQSLNEDMQYIAGVKYAKSRVNSAKNKLNGINPCVITQEDLMNGIHKDGKYLKHFQNALLGLNVVDKESNLVNERSRLLKEKGEKYKLTVEEQVKCIIEQAIDPTLLGRTWNGWQPYI